MLSIENVYQEHAQTVYRYLLSLSHNENVAEELTQETFFQAVKSAERFNGSCKVATWLCAIAKNSFLSYCRKHPLIDELTENTLSNETVDKSVIESLSRVELLRKMHSLNEDTREVMYLRLFGDLSFSEIGDVLSKTENWARVTFYRGKEKLKKELNSDGE